MLDGSLVQNECTYFYVPVSGASAMERYTTLPVHYTTLPQKDNRFKCQNINGDRMCHPWTCLKTTSDETEQSVDKSENCMEAFVNTKTESRLLRKDGGCLSPGNLQRHRHHDDSSHPCKVQFHTKQKPSNFHANVSSVSTFRMNTKTPLFYETHSAAKCQAHIASHNASSAKLRWKDNRPMITEPSGLRTPDSTESQKLNTADKTTIPAHFRQKPSPTEVDLDNVLITGIHDEQCCQTTKTSPVQPTQSPTEGLVDVADSLNDETITYELNLTNSIQNHPLIESTDIG
ncbi:hypothetical protein EG68_02199 [Paragonimus skrjabini miyazakii]|uniref:Uncharacterized protein n=1 Tax=Paragonimus skrjabini miyazakii TaxID=59628 RepID=A0A8S9Z8Z4_9TREM|nr:hypothetical protein EG68_02199 [Paragonimus skrjabini miyazakii]